MDVLSLLLQSVCNTSVTCFRGWGYCTLYQNLYYSMNSLKAFKVAHKNQSRFNCKFLYPSWSSSSIKFHFISLSPYVDTKLWWKKTTASQKEKCYFFLSYFPLATQKTFVACSLILLFLFTLMHPIRSLCKKMI